MPRRRLAVVGGLVALLVAGAAAAGLPVQASHRAQTSGDEPHYLITALSLAQDGDLDTANQVDGDHYRSFHEPDLRPQAARQPGGRMVVPHNPLLPALLAPAMGAAGWVGAKVALAAVAGAVGGLLVWTAVRRLGTGLPAAAVAAGLLGASAPLATYGTQVYPELPAGLAVLAGVAAVTGALRRSGLVVLAVAVVGLPWLSVKYVPVAAALAVAGLLHLWRDGRRPLAVAVVGVLLLAGVAYVAAHLSWYGGVTPYAAGRFFQAHGGQTAVVGTDPQYLARSTRLIGLLIDRRFGLAAWQPGWLLLVPAAAALLRRRPRGWGAVAAPLVAGWLVATFVSATMHGWWFPGRQVVVVLPLAVLVLAWWADAGRTRLAALAGAGLAGVATYAWLVVEGWQHRLTWVVDFAATSGPYRLWQWTLPAYEEPSPSTWAVHGAWLLAAAAIAWWGASGARRPEVAARAS